VPVLLNLSSTKYDTLSPSLEEQYFFYSYVYLHFTNLNMLEVILCEEKNVAV